MKKLISNINSPKDIKELNTDELNSLASDIRAFLIDSVSKTGGHLASNLGIVELTLNPARPIHWACLIFSRASEC